MSRAVIRRVDVADADAVALVRVRSWQAAYAGLLPASYLDAMDVAHNADLFRRRLSAPAVHSDDWLVEWEGQIVGWGNIQSTSRDEDAEPGCAELIALYVLPSHWGYGLGHRMMHHLMAVLADVGSKRVTLWVLEGNQRARAFYERQGFEVDGRRKEVSLLEGVVLCEVSYQRAL